MNKYIDCHSHILFGIDDGAKTIEDSVNIIKELIKLGFESIILTPHYRVLNKLRIRLMQEDININLYLANEVKITSNILELISKDEIELYGNYLFLELPFDTKIHNLEKYIYELQDSNINIILVHPERYNYLTKEDYQRLLDYDVLFQTNYESIIGKYGFNAKKRVKYLLKNNMVTFIASDVHKTTTPLFKYFDKIKKKTIKLVGEENFKKLTYDNIKKVIDENL